MSNYARFMICLVFSALLLAQSGNAANQMESSDWRETARAANLAYVEKKYDAAANLYEVALKAMDNSSQPPEVIIDVLANRAECLVKSKNFIEAARCLARCLELVRTHNLEHQPVAIRVLNRMDMLKVRRGDPLADCLAIRTQRLRLAEELFGEHAELVHSYVYPVAISLFDAKRYLDAIEIGAKGFKLLDGASRYSAPLYRVELTNPVAMSYAALGRPDEAKDCYQRTISYLRNIPGADEPLARALAGYEQLERSFPKGN